MGAAKSLLLGLALFLEEDRLALIAGGTVCSLVGALIAQADALTAVLATAIGFAIGVAVTSLSDVLVGLLVPRGPAERVVVLGGDDPQPEERAGDIEDLGQRCGGA